MVVASAQSVWIPNKTTYSHIVHIVVEAISGSRISHTHVSLVLLVVPPVCFFAGLHCMCHLNVVQSPSPTFFTCNRCSQTSCISTFNVLNGKYGYDDHKTLRSFGSFPQCTRRKSLFHEYTFNHEMSFVLRLHAAGERQLPMMAGNAIQQSDSSGHIAELCCVRCCKLSVSDQMQKTVTAKNVFINTLMYDC